MGADTIKTAPTILDAETRENHQGCIIVDCNQPLQKDDTLSSPALTAWTVAYSRTRVSAAKTDSDLLQGPKLASKVSFLFPPHPPSFSRRIRGTC